MDLFTVVRYNNAIGFSNSQELHMNTIDGSAIRDVLVRANITPLFSEALPQAKCAPLVQHTIRFPASDLRAAESDALYEPYNQLGGSKKSFHLSEYFFSSNIKKLFFDTNLFYDASIAHIWYTGMRAKLLPEASNAASDEVRRGADKTSFASAETPCVAAPGTAAADFFVPYRDFDNRALCLYRPDFVIETKRGRFYIIEIADGRTAHERIVRAKREYIEAANARTGEVRLEYVCIPPRYADMRFERFLSAHGAAPHRTGGTVF